MNPDDVRRELSRKWVDDEQSMLAEEARLILRGKLRATMTDRHREALSLSNREALSIGRIGEVADQPF